MMHLRHINAGTVIYAVEPAGPPPQSEGPFRRKRYTHWEVNKVIFQNEDSRRYTSATPRWAKLDYMSRHRCLLVQGHLRQYASGETPVVRYHVHPEDCFVTRDEAERECAARALEGPP